MYYPGRLQKRAATLGSRSIVAAAAGDIRVEKFCVPLSQRDACLKSGTWRCRGVVFSLLLSIPGLILGRYLDEATPWYQLAFEGFDFVHFAHCMALA